MKNASILATALVLGCAVMGSGCVDLGSARSSSELAGLAEDSGFAWVRMSTHGMT